MFTVFIVRSRGIIQDDNRTHQISRRKLLKASGASVVTASIGFPTILSAQSKSVKIGFIHPASGFLAYPGAQCRLGGQMAVEEINAAGGIRSIGAKLEAVLGDSQGKPEIGSSEVEKTLLGSERGGF